MGTWLNVEEGSISEQRNNFINAQEQYNDKLSEIESLIASLKGKAIVGPVAENLEQLYLDKKPILQKVDETFQEFIDNLGKADSETQATLDNIKLR